MNFRSSCLPVYCGASVFVLVLSSCGGDQSAETAPPPVDTVVQTVTVAVPEAIDSAAVVAYYEAAHKKAVSNNTPKHVAHPTEKGKKMLVDSYEPVEHHDVAKAPAPTTASGSQAPAGETVVVVHDVETVYFRPDEKASFPGGEKAFDEYLVKNIQYPKEALDYGMEGVVNAVVALDEQGKVTGVTFPDKRLGFGLNREAERLLMSSPRWNPAKHAGQPVKSKFAVPIRFKFQ